LLFSSPMLVELESEPSARGALWPARLLFGLATAQPESTGTREGNASAPRPATPAFVVEDCGDDIDDEEAGPLLPLLLLLLLLALLW